MLLDAIVKLLVSRQSVDQSVLRLGVFHVDLGCSLILKQKNASRMCLMKIWLLLQPRLMLGSTTTMKMAPSRLWS